MTDIAYKYQGYQDAYQGKYQGVSLVYQGYQGLSHFSVRVRESKTTTPSNAQKVRLASRIYPDIPDMPVHRCFTYTFFSCTLICTLISLIHTGYARAASFFYFFSQEKKMMEETPAKAAPTAAPVVTRRIACTPANAPAFRELVKNTPRLLEVVEHLKAQGLFPGLRGMSVVITGSAETVANGVDALLQKNGSKAV